MQSKANTAIEDKLNQFVESLVSLHPDWTDDDLEKAIQSWIQEQDPGVKKSLKSGLVTNAITSLIFDAHEERVVSRAECGEKHVAPEAAELTARTLGLKPESA